MQHHLVARLLATGVLAACIVMPASASLAQSGDGEPSLFVSPCGRPYRADPGQPYPVAVWFDAADANKDGKLDRPEFRADAATFFKALDQDHNGVVEGMEISFYERRILPEMLQNQQFGALAAPALLIRAQYGGIGEPGGPDGPPVVSSDDSASQRAPRESMANLQGAAPYNFLREPEPVTASDGDFNHRITVAEFEAAADRRFKLLDKDGDGFLILATLPRTAVQAAMSPGGGRRRR